MAITIDPQIQTLAKNASNATGLDPNVILAHWMSEQGISSTNDWFYNNPAGITPGNPNADSIRSGTKYYAKTGMTFNTYQAPAFGAQAYTMLINTDPNYTGIRAAIQTKDPLKEIQAIGASKWGTNATSLMSNYQLLTGANPSGNGTSNIGSGSAEGQAGAPGGSNSLWPSWMNNLDPAGVATKGFWMLLGGIVLVLGIWVMVNPLANVSNAISEISKGGAEGAEA